MATDIPYDLAVWVHRPERCRVTKLLEQAIAAVRELSDSEPDEAAEILFSLASRDRGPVILDDETRTAIQEGREQARRGEFASDAEMAAFFRRET
jgi:hypothetical protein